MLTLYSQESTGNSTDADERSGRDEPETVVRDIHALTPEDRSRPLPPPPPFRGYFSPARSASLSDAASSSENFTTISREFNALVIAGSSMDHNNNHNNSNNGNSNNNNDLSRIGEEEDEGRVPEEEETNPLAIVPDHGIISGVGSGSGRVTTEAVASVQRVKREEVEAKITAWQNAKVAKINNRFKREDAIINGWENEQVHKANSWMKKIERKLEERRAKAMEKMENKVAKARRKAEERRATSESKRGTEVARVLEVANLMRAVGRPPAKRSFFSFS